MVTFLSNSYEFLEHFAYLFFNGFFVILLNLLNNLSEPDTVLSEPQAEIKPNYRVDQNTIKKEELGRGQKLGAVLLAFFGVLAVTSPCLDIVTDNHRYLRLFAVAHFPQIQNDTEITFLPLTKSAGCL